MMNIQWISSSVAPKWQNYRKYLKPIFSKIFEIEKVIPSKQSVSVILITEKEMHEMNDRYRNIDRPTDVLTFVDEEDAEYLGDIFINVTAVEEQAKDYGHTKKREFCFLVTHGALHLLGYDHQDAQSEKEMFTLQEEILYDIAPKSHTKV